MRSSRLHLTAFLGLLTLFSGQLAYAKAELICPCTMTSVGQTAWGIEAGLRNSESTTTPNLRFRLTLRDVTDTTGAFFIGGFVTLDALDPDEMRSAATYKTGLVVPTDGDYIVNIELQEETFAGVWTTTDALRFRQEAALAHVGGSSANSNFDEEVGAIYLDGEISVTSVAGGQIIFDLPAVVNGSGSFTSATLQLQFVRTNTPSVFGSFFPLGTVNLGGPLAPGESIAAQTITTPYSEASTSGNYVHVSINPQGSNSALAWETIRWLGGAAEERRDLTLNGIELLEDDDGDGVSNFNERLAGTAVDDGADTPGGSRIDVLVKYTQGVPGLYSEDASARIDHLVGFSNQVLAASGVNATLNLVGSGQITTNELFTLSSILDLMEAEQEGFEGLEAERVAVGADLVVVLIPFPGGGLCGLANLGGQGKKGDLSNPINANLAHAAVYVDCRDNVTIHEIGHVMGLTHSRVESARENDTGTFDWSVGHGVDNSFATVMANTDDYGGFGAEEVNILSNPALLCDPTVDDTPPHASGAPCGVVHTDRDSGADAAFSLNTVRFQVAAFRQEQSALDTDGDGMANDVDEDDDNDGVPDSEDAFPLDDSESVDTDGDFIGNNTDPDDDGDGVPDDSDAFPLDPTRSDEPDNSGRLGNISTRGIVGIGDDVMIGGLIIEGETNITVLVRGRGPSLAGFVTGELEDPSLELFDINGNLIETNLDWQDHPREGEIPAALAPTVPQESAIVIDLAPGGYTAILRGESGATGVGIVEVFEL